MRASSQKDCLIVDLIIPALNEAANIDALFDELSRVNAKDVRLRRVLLADNGSTDGTPELAAGRGAVVVREMQRGYGAACLKAIDWIAREAASGEPPDVVVFMDADLADDPAATPMLLAPILRHEADIVIGSRVKLAISGALNFVQRFGNGLACRMIHLLGGRRYSDLGPFRAVRWTTLQQLNMSDRTWGWTVEMQMKAALMDVSTVEVNVPYRTRRHGRSKISGTVRGVLKAGVKIIITILALWWRRNVIRRAGAYAIAPCANISLTDAQSDSP